MGGLALQLLGACGALCKNTWEDLANDARIVAEVLCDELKDSDEATRFLRWKELREEDQLQNLKGGRQCSGPNACRVEQGKRQVDIHLGSIHSIKGQTHLATLILDTYWHDRFMERMLPWLDGASTNGSGAGSRDSKRLKLTYVAMTRPSHMVCLAIPRRVLEKNGETLDLEVGVLRERGWEVILVDGESPS